MTGNLHEDPTAFIISRVILRRIKNVSRRTFGQNQKACFNFNNLFFFENRALLWDNVEKYGSVGQATTDNMAHAYCMMDT